MSTIQLYTTHNLFLELCPILLCGYCLHCFYDVRILLKQEKSNLHFVAEVDLGWSKYSRRICSAELRTWDEWMKSLLSVPSLSTMFKKWWKCFCMQIFLPIGIIFNGFLSVWPNPSWSFSELLRSNDKLELILKCSSSDIEFWKGYLLFIRKCVTLIICAPISAAPHLAPCWLYLYFSAKLNRIKCKKLWVYIPCWLQWLAGVNGKDKD